MREIKFKGKRIDNGEWVYGDLYRHEPPLQGVICENYIPEQVKYYIMQTGFADWNMPRPIVFIPVIPETVGQSTGRTDRNEKEIYEGDTLAMPIDENPQERDVCDVRWCEKAAAYRVYFQPNNHEELYLDDIEPEVYSTIIGNIHEGVTE